MYFITLTGKKSQEVLQYLKNEILNPARLPEYQVRFLPESETIYGGFVGLDSVKSYIDHMIYRHFGNKGIHSEIIDTY